MRFRICDNGRERITPATMQLIEQTFAPEAPINEGTEITMADGERWLAAIAVGFAGEGGEFLVSSGPEESAPAGRIARDAALRCFREFLLASAPAP
jgi:hypothetical protein